MACRPRRTPWIFRARDRLMTVDRLLGPAKVQIELGAGRVTLAEPEHPWPFGLWVPFELKRFNR